MTGSQEPRLKIEPERFDTDGTDAGQIMGAYGSRLDPWQQMIVDCWLLQTDGVTWMVALVICIALAVTILLSKVVGAILPMLAEKLGFDPALMASPIITTVVDALSLLVYYNVARVMLGL